MRMCHMSHRKRKQPYPWILLLLTTCTHVLYNRSIGIKKKMQRSCREGVNRVAKASVLR